MAIYPPSKPAGVGGGGFSSRAPKNFLLFSFLSSYSRSLESRSGRRTFGARLAHFLLRSRLNALFLGGDVGV